jgi:hypothetical protein
VKRKFKFNKKYFIATLIIFFTEVLIAVYVRDKIIRPYVGDILVAVLVYCFLKSFLNISVKAACIITLVFSFTVEFLQFFNLVEKLGLQHSKIARTVIGNSFEWTDLLMYTIGIIIVFLLEKTTKKNNFSS